MVIEGERALATGKKQNKNQKQKQGFAGSWSGEADPHAGSATFWLEEPGESSCPLWA